MTKRIVFTLTITLFTCFILRLYSQVPTENRIMTPLTSVLKKLENNYDVRFSYADELISSIYIQESPSYKDLETAILYIENKTGLVFETLNDRFIVIKDASSINKIQELDNVYISNLLTSGISKSNSGITIIKPKQFGILPGIIEPDILQTVQALPGILSADETVSNLNIRGGTNDQNLILWDGIKMYQSGHFFGLISAFNPYLTKRVEIVKNGTSAAYGDGISGTINIELDDTITDSIQGSLSTNLIHIKGYAKVPLSKKLTVLASARRSNTDFLKTPTYDSYTERIFQDTDLRSTIQRESTATNIDFYFYDASVKVVYDLSPRDNLRMSATTIFNKLSYEEALAEPGRVTESGISQGNNGVKLNYTRKWSPFFYTSIEAYGSNYNLAGRNFDVNNDQQLDQENEVLDLGVKAQTRIKKGDRFEWVNGYQFFEVSARNLAQTNNPAFFRNERNVIRTHALFSEASLFSTNNRTQVTAGVRANYIPTLNEFIIEPRLRFSQRIWNYIKVEALAEYKNQSISQIIDQPNDFLGIERRRWVSADGADIPVIKSKQASLSINYTKNKWLLSAEGFIKNVVGISSRSQGFQNQFQFTSEIGNYDILGIDFLLSKRFQRFGTWLSYSFSDNRYAFENLNEGRRFPNNTNVRHFLTFGSSYTAKRFKYSLGFNWRTGTPITRPDFEASTNAGTIIYQRPNSDLSDNFLRVDVSAIFNFKIFNNKAQIGASIWNLLDNDNTIQTFYNRSDQGDIKEVSKKSLGLTPNLSFQWSF